MDMDKEEEVYLSGSSVLLLLSELSKDHDPDNPQGYYNLSCSSSGFSSCPGGGPSSLLTIGETPCTRTIARAASARAAEGQWRRRNKRERNLSQVVLKTRHQEEKPPRPQEGRDLAQDARDRIARLSSFRGSDREPGLALSAGSREPDSGLFVSPPPGGSAANQESLYDKSLSSTSSSDYSSNRCLVKIGGEGDPAPDPNTEYESQDLSLWLDEEDESAVGSGDEVVTWRCTGTGVRRRTVVAAARRRKRRRRKRKSGGVLDGEEGRQTGREHQI